MGKIKAVVRQAFYGGWSVGKKIGIKNSQAFTEAFDFRKNPSQMSVLPSPTREDNGVVRDLIQNEVITSDGTIYAIGSLGAFYKRTPSAIWSKEADIGVGTYGLDYRRDTNAIYAPTTKHVSLYNNVSSTNGSAAMYMSFYGPSYSTLDNSSTVGFNVAAYQAPGTTSYTPPTSIVENQANTRYFQSDIEPLQRISVFANTKGTGNWTVTVHDGNNNNLGSATVSNANLVANTWNDFVFTNQIRIYVAPNARTYHIHVTSTVADGALSTSSVNDLSACALEVWADRLVQTNNGMHPMDRFLQYEIFGNGNYVSAWEPLTVGPPPASDTSTPASMGAWNLEWLRHRLVFPMEYEVCGLAHTNEYLAVALEQGLNSQVDTQTPTNLTGTGANDATVGTQPWVNPTNISTDDTDNASVALSGAGGTGISEYLTATNFGFSVPVGATILGITASFNRKRDLLGGVVTDNAVKLVKGGTVTGDNKAGQTWSKTQSIQTYGSGNDLWGTALTPADVNASNFGVAISATAFNPSSAYVYAVYVTVYYSVASAASYNSTQSGLIAFWDGSSPTYNFYLEVPEGSPYALHTYKNVVYYYAGGDWYTLTSPTTLPVKIWSMPGAQREFTNSNSPIVLYPYAATVRRNVHLMAYPSASTAPDINFGVYSWGAVDKNFPDSFGYSYVISTGSQNYSTSNNLTIGMVKNFGDTLHISWRDDQNGGYGVDVVTNSSNPAPVAIWQDLVFDNGYAGKPKTALYMDCYFYLPAGASLQMAYAIDNNDFVLDPNTYTSNDLWQGQNNYARFQINSDNQGRFYEIQTQITVTCDSSVSQPPVIRMVSLVFDDNSNEQLS